MGANPRVVTQDTDFRWDGVSQRLRRGQIIDVPADGPLEKAIGPDRLVPLFGSTATPEAPEAAEQEETPAPKAKAKPKDSSDEDKASPEPEGEH
jgi:hypothetical protein